MAETSTPQPPLTAPRTPPSYATTERRIRRSFAVALFCLGGIGIFTFFSVSRLRKDAGWIAHTHSVIGQLQAILEQTAAAQSAYRGFAFTDDDVFLEPHHAAARMLPTDLGRLQAAIADNGAQLQRLTALVPLVTEQLDFGRRVIETRRAQGVDAAAALIQAQDGRRLHDSVRAHVVAMKQAEETLLIARERQTEQSASFARGIIVLGSLFAFTSVGLALAANRRDFAARRRAEESLRDSEENLAVTLHSIGDAVLATDTTACVTHMNEVAERLTGWPLAEARGRPIAEVFRIINEQTREPAKIPVAEVLATGEVHGLANHTILIARDGSERSIADSAAPIRGLDGTIRGVVLVFRDVSAERAAEIKLARAHTELARERERLQFIFDSVPMGISFALTQPDGHRTRLVNENHLRLCGLTRAEFDDSRNFARITHPDDRAVQLELLRDLDAGKIDRYAIDKRYLHADGRVVWVFLVVQRRRHSDGSYEDLSVVIDITDRKEAEAQVERFFTVSLDLLCISSADGFFKRVSPAVTDTLGWTTEEFLARPFIDMVHPEDRAATLAEVERQIVSGQKVLNFENRYRHKDGAWRVLSWRSVPQPGGLMYATARDVTEARRHEEAITRLNTALRQRAAQVEEANKELEAFSYSVSHDLRAPVRHIQGFCALLARENDPPFSDKSRRYLEVISGAAGNMAQLIDDLLSFSRMARTEMHQAKVQLAPLVEETRKDLEPATRDRTIHWKIGHLPAVQGDRALLKQIFVNLLGNSVKYTRPRNPAEIEIGSQGETDGFVVFFVRDNGVGFDMAYADKLFGVFQRLHLATEFEGTGIGLANVQRIVVRHGGRIWAESKPNGGATFYFTLPRAAAQSAAVPSS